MEHEILKTLMDNELSILEETCHPHIVSIYELLHDDKFYFIVSEFVRYGELYDYIIQSNKISESIIKKICLQMF